MNIITYRRINILVLILISLILLIAFYFQLFIDNVLPCALCNLQRAGFLLFGIGLIITLYSNDIRMGQLVCIASGILGGSVALLHVLVELPPGMPSVGSSIFGVHMYGWVFIIFNILISYTAISAILFKQSSLCSIGINRSYTLKCVIALFGFICFANLFSVFLENGIKPMGFPQYHYWVICKYQHKSDAECSRPNLDDILQEYKNNLKKLKSSWQNN